MTITIQNSSGQQIKAAINQWGTGGDTNDFTISNSKSESWDRTDPRGFVAYIVFSGGTNSSIVFAGKTYNWTGTALVPQ